MKLHKSLKKRKSLVGEITTIKQHILEKNSSLEGSKNAELYNVTELNTELMDKINELIGLKFAINEANQEIQSKIYILGEYKALIAFWKTVSVDEGSKVIGYSDNVKNYVVQFNEKKRDALISGYQKKVDALQEEIDVYNYTTDIPWEEPVVEEAREIPSVPPEDRSKLNEGHDSKD